ncbi:hypothetical protein SEA_SCOOBYDOOBYDOO_210 [Mycobacterium phage ScoobyDoobyDoo]|nr:hypothetical protein SEA_SCOOBYDOOBYDOO_210 [Mycobacterium phage ScoobyDoobyDoo]
MPYSNEYIEHVFSYHPPKDGQAQVYETIRVHAREFFKVINRLVPDGADKADALRKLREVVMTANAGIALDGGPQPHASAVPPKEFVEKVAETARNYQTTEWPQPVSGITPVRKRPDGYTEIQVNKGGTGAEGKPIDSLVDEYLKGKGL